MTSPNEPTPQPVPGEPYQTAPLAAAAIEEGASAYTALAVTPWMQLVRDAVLPPGGPVDPYGVLSGTAFWLSGVRDWLRETVWPFIRAPWQSLFGVYFDSADPWLRNYTQTVENLLVNTPYIVYAKVREMVGNVAEQGTSLRDLAEQIDATLLDTGSPWWANRSMTVARTEMRRGQMGGLWHAYDDFGRRENLAFIKTWIDSHDSRVREAHVDTDGQTRTLGVPFMVGIRLGPKYPAMMPLDPALPPELSINCRCDVLIEQLGERATAMGFRRWGGTR